MPSSGLLTNLQGYWTLDEASGTRADSSGNGNSLTDVNTVTQAAGKLTNAAQFTSANRERLTINDNTSLSMGDIDFTLCCWVYFDSLNEQGLVVKWNGTGDEYTIYYNGGMNRIAFGVDGGGGLVQVAADALGTPSTATWYFVCAWHDSVANTINIQVNNGTINTVSHSAGVQDSNGVFRLGEISGNYLNGRLDGVGVWKRVLTQSERAYLYNYGGGNDYAFSIVWTGPYRDRTPLSVKTSHQVWLCNPAGYRVQLISDYVSLKYNRAIKGGSGLTLELLPGFDTRYLRDFSLIEVWRRVGEQAIRHEDVFVIQSIPQAQTHRGTKFLTLEGPTMTDYLLGKNSRVVDAVEGATGGAYTDTTDNLLRLFTFDQLGVGAGSSGTSEGRDLSIYAGFTVEASRSMGPSVTVNGFLRPLDDVLAEIRKKSEENTVSPLRLFWTIRAKSFNPLRFEFIVLPRYYGRYRGFTAAAPVIFAPMFSNVAQVEIEHDFREAWDAVFVTYGGTKASSTRIINTARRNVAPIAFREVYFDAANSATEAAAQVEAQSKLNEGKERKLARVTVVSNATHRYGAEYLLGDVVGTMFLGRRVEMEIAGEEISRNKDGETVSLKLDEI